MKILLICLLAVATVILLLLLILLIKIGVYCEMVYTQKEGFNFKGKITFLCFSIKLKQKKKNKKEKIPKKKKSEAGIIDTIKNGAKIVKELAWIPGKVLVFKRQFLWCKVSFENPAKNGIIYTAISGALMQAMQVIVSRFKTDEYKLRVTPDFKDKDGISIKDITWVQFRPLSLIICLIYAYKKSEELRNAINFFINKSKKKGTGENE